MIYPLLSFRHRPALDVWQTSCRLSGWQPLPSISGATQSNWELCNHGGHDTADVSPSECRGFRVSQFDYMAVPFLPVTPAGCRTPTDQCSVTTAVAPAPAFMGGTEGIFELLTACPRQWPLWSAGVPLAPQRLPPCIYAVSHSLKFSPPVWSVWVEEACAGLLL